MNAKIVSVSTAQTTIAPGNAQTALEFATRAPLDSIGKLTVEPVSAAARNVARTNGRSLIAKKEENYRIASAARVLT